MVEPSTEWLLQGGMCRRSRNGCMARTFMRNSRNVLRTSDAHRQARKSKGRARTGRLKLGKENSMDDQMILGLQAKGMSLRQIASALGLSHEGIRRRLKRLESNDQVSTKPDDRMLTASAIGNEKVLTGSDAHGSKASEESEDTVNQVSTSKTPSLTPNGTVCGAVNPRQRPCRGPRRDENKGPQGVFLENGTFFQPFGKFSRRGGLRCIAWKAMHTKAIRCATVTKRSVFMFKDINLIEIDMLEKPKEQAL